MPPGQLDDWLVLHVSGRGHHEVRGDVARGVVLRDRVLGDGGDHIGLAEDPAPQRVVAVHRFSEHVVDAVRRLVVVHRDLLEHDLTLGVDLVLGQRRAQEHLGHEVEDAVRVLVEETGVQVRRLLAGRGVGRRPHPVEQLRDARGRVALRPLEQQVLEEVGDARLRVPLVAGARAHPHPERHRAHRGHCLGDHPETGLQLGELYVLWKCAGLSHWV